LIPADLDALAAGLPPSALMREYEDLSAYAVGARYGRGRPAFVVRPASLEQVRHVVRWAVASNVALVAQGANTGLVGASTPDEGGRCGVVSFERLREPSTIDAQERTARVAAGLRLSSLNALLEPLGLWFPIDLGADPSIGGMVATNTGGTRLMRYGDVRRNLLALQVVLPNADATVLELRSGFRKDNTALALEQLFCGSAGSLGIVTTATLALHARPRQRATALLIPRDADAMPLLMNRLTDDLGEILAAVEYMSGAAMRRALRHFPQTRNPFAPGPVPNLAMLVELESSLVRRPGFDLSVWMEEWLTQVGGSADTGLLDAVLDCSDSAWGLRHRISESLRTAGRVIAFDLSLPRAAWAKFRANVTAQLSARWPMLEVCDFGHFGDGGTHFNLLWPHEAPKPPSTSDIEGIRELVIGTLVSKYDGRFSAEHGVGPYNLDIYRARTSEAVLRAASAVQRALDPDRRLGRVDFGPAG
jgi:FAD/FMN-containing dehydrogenase